jgi:hypothetical protein
MTLDAEILLPAGIEQRFGIAERLADCIEGPRAPERRHTLAEMIRYRALLIETGYRDGNYAMHCVPARPSRWRAVGRREAVPICARNQPSVETCRDKLEP